MAKRRSVNFPGFSHANPIPNASRIGNIMMSSVINGRDPETAQMPEDMAAQVVNIFKHVAAAVAHEGGSPEDILKISFWVGDPSTGRGALNGEWEAMFPDENARPARHTHTLNASGPAKVTCEFTAVFSD